MTVDTVCFLALDVLTGKLLRNFSFSYPKEKRNKNPFGLSVH